jgi:hypothetical protein
VGTWLARHWVRRVAGVLLLGFGVFSTLGTARQVGLGSPFGSSPHHCCPGGGRPAAGTLHAGVGSTRVLEDPK